MEYTKLGRTGLRVSRLCLGTMNFGSTTPESEAFKIMDAALEAGINFFDTANNYGFLTGNVGVTEKILGNWFSQGSSRRERVVLATKVHEDMHDPNDGPNTAPGLSVYKIRRHLESSMKRLQTDHVELYYMHHIDRNVTWDETWDAFENLYSRGIIDYVGASNFPAWQLAMAQGEAKARHFMGISVEQDKYSLTCRTPELEVLPACRALGIGVVAWGPLDGGLLAGGAGDTLRKANNADAYRKHQKQLEAYRHFCADAGLREADTALAWILQNPVLTGPIIGARTLSQLENCLKALEVRLDGEMLAELDKIFPGTAPAPEAYAW